MEEDEEEVEDGTGLGCTVRKVYTLLRWLPEMRVHVSVIL